MKHILESVWGASDGEDCALVSPKTCTVCSSLLHFPPPSKIHGSWELLFYREQWEGGMKPLP